MSSEDLEIPLLREPLERRPTFLATFSFRPSADINCSPIASATILQTSVIIVSIYVGLGLLSQPYAIHLGGWAALAALAGVAALFYTSASLLVSACDALPESAPKSLPHLGSVLWGRAGKSMVTFIAGLELFGSLAISLVVVFQQVELFLPTEGLFDLSPMKIAYIITSASLIPLLAMHDVSRLTPLAMAGSGASICVALAVLSLLGIDPGRTKLPLQPPAGHAIVDWPVGLLQSIGIFAVSMSGHTTLPAVRKAMLRPERFQTSVAGAFAIMVTLYAVVGGFGYWYWGDDVSPVAIYDLATNSPYARVRGATSWYQWIGIDRVLAALVLITCSAKVPALIFVIQELLLGAVHPTGVLNFKEQYAARLVVAASAFALAAAARNSLGSVLGLVGGACSMTVSLVLPVLFYMQLTWRRTALPRRVGLVTFAAFAVCLLVVVTGLNLQAMINNDDRRRRHPDDAFGFVEPQLLSH